MNLEYRKGSVEDSKVLAKYRVEFLNEVMGIDEHKDSQQLESELFDFFEKHIGDGSLIVWLAEDDRKIVATSSLVIWNVPLGYGGLGCQGRRGYILNMYTIDGYRKKGIGSELLNKLIDEAKSLKLEFVSLHATNDGLGVYKKLGFKEPQFPELKLKV